MTGAATWIAVARAGFSDGWSQPHDLSTSTNIDHLRLDGDDERSQGWIELLDRWINIGQFARAGFRSQPWREGWWPFRWRR